MKLGLLLAAGARCVYCQLAPIEYMQKHHVIITGTGRAGTTFLLHLMTQLGLNTGYTPETFEIAVTSNAGSEWNIRRADAPYIVKSTWLSDILDEAITELDLVIDHAIIPVRDLFSAAESRRDVVRRTPDGIYPGDIPGGLIYTNIPQQQEFQLATKQCKLLYALARHDIPNTLLHFPRLALDPEYLYAKLPFLFGAIEHAVFVDAFQRISRPELIHDFTNLADDIHAPAA